MITTRFLPIDEYASYGDWMKSQDPETLHMYFGFSANHEYIDRLVKNIMTNNNIHHFLVAENDGVLVGVTHIAESVGGEVEFGITVDKAHRKQGIADIMISKAILWARNRGYHTLYMHCLTWNTPIKKLCAKHGLTIKSAYGESETKITLPPYNPISIGQEIVAEQRNVYRMLLQQNLNYLRSISSSTQFSPY